MNEFGNFVASIMEEYNSPANLRNLMTLTAALAVAQARWTDEDTKQFGTMCRDMLNAK